MLRSKNIDRICCVVLAVTLLITTAFLRAAATGFISESRTIGYESRLFDASRVHTIDIVIDDWEGFLETWNNRYRISNICVFDNADRNRGIGSLLMDTILKEASALKARMVVLETQTCNENAIAFYRRYGFEIIGFDLYAYSNTDPEKHEIRIEMGRKLG